MVMHVDFCSLLFALVTYLLLAFIIYIFLVQLLHF